MAEVRVATFNVENLFARWKFKEGIDPEQANERGWIVEEANFVELGKDEKKITGLAIKEIEADVIAMQEVENVETLKHFRTDHLGGRSAYPYVAGIDGNDPRLIDVVVLSKLPIVHVRSFQHVLDSLHKSEELFSRDCLEVEVEVEAGKTLTLFVNHLKSMMAGRKKSHDRRQRQATGVIDLVKKRFGPNPGKASFVVLGDFNDYMETDEEGESAIADLVEWDQVENVVTRLPAAEQWTHYWKGGNEYRQLDYMLLSKSLAAASDDNPEIMRKGAPLRAVKYEGERFPGVGKDNPKASDHCPVVMNVAVG